jgi:hypothetical protein
MSEHQHNWKIYCDRNFASPTFGELGAACYYGDCPAKLTREQVNNRLTHADALALVMMSLIGLAVSAGYGDHEDVQKGRDALAAWEETK